MLVLQTSTISKSYGPNNILSNLTLQVQDKDKIGIVGPNGAGKSTFLKIIAGLINADSGTVQLTKGSRLGYLAQNDGLDSDLTIWQEMLTVFQDLLADEIEIRRLEQEMALIDPLADTNAWDNLSRKYASLQESFESAGGYRMEADIRSILSGLGFADFDYQEQTISTLSGGQKTRLALAKILLADPDIILLDEPTNYLDIDALTWLEAYIKNFRGALLVVSHDRYFLDAFVTGIYEINQHQGTLYRGNYKYYQNLKAERLAQAERLYQAQQEEIKKTEDFIQRNIARDSTSNRAKGRQKQLARMDRLDSPTRESETFFSFHARQRSGNIVLEIEDLALTFPDYGLLFQGLNFLVERGDRIAIIGPNGTGKSTLLKIIVGQLEASSGKVSYGSKLDIGYYDQEQAALKPDNTILEEIHASFPSMTLTEVRSALAQFLFFGTDVDKAISQLSGGEKSRVALTKLMLAQDNLLLLDEPTNHLDIGAKEVLERALLDYEGTLICVSHDRYFLNQLATKIVYMTNQGLTVYLGNYDYYLAKVEEAKLQAIEDAKKLAESATKGGQQTGLSVIKNVGNKSEEDTLDGREAYEADKRRQSEARKLARRYQEVEDAIHAEEEKIQQIEKDLCNPQIFDNHIELTRLQIERDQAESKLEDLLVEWENLAKELE